MYKAIHKELSWDVELSPNGDSARLNGKEVKFDRVVADHFREHLITPTGAYRIEWLGADPETRSLRLRVNGKETELVVKDQFDLLLEQLGMDTLSSSKVADLKAPMPGLVLSIPATPGQEVKKGDPLIILEAMKMENVLKSPTDGVIREVLVKEKQAVEKNFTLLTFEH